MQLDYCKVGVAGQGVTRDSSQKNLGEKRAVYLQGANNLSLNQDTFEGEKDAIHYCQAARGNWDVPV